jgi:hypothetical protein
MANRTMRALFLVAVATATAAIEQTLAVCTAAAGACGSPSFGAAQNEPSGGTVPFTVVAGDFTGDGVEDVAVANADTGTVSVLRGNGNGTLDSAVIVATGLGGSLAAGYIDEDDALDLAASTSVNAWVLLNDGSGTFTPHGPFPVPGNIPVWTARASDRTP